MSPQDALSLKGSAPSTPDSEPLQAILSCTAQAKLHPRERGAFSPQSISSQPEASLPQYSLSELLGERKQVQVQLDQSWSIAPLTRAWHHLAGCKASPADTTEPITAERGYVGRASGWESPWVEQTSQVPPVSCHPR